MKKMDMNSRLSGALEDKRTEKNQAQKVLERAKSRMTGKRFVILTEPDSQKTVIEVEEMKFNKLANRYEKYKNRQQVDMATQGTIGGKELILGNGVTMPIAHFGKISLIHGDCMDFMRSLPDKAFDLAVVDPPYGIGAAKMNMGHTKANKPKWDKKDWDSSIPDAEYFAELFRVSSNQIIFGGNYFTEHLPASRCWLSWNKGVYSNSEICVVVTHKKHPKSLCPTFGVQFIAVRCFLFLLSLSPAFMVRILTNKR